MEVGNVTHSVSTTVAESSAFSQVQFQGVFSSQPVPHSAAFFLSTTLLQLIDDMN